MEVGVGVDRCSLSYSVVGNICIVGWRSCVRTVVVVRCVGRGGCGERGVGVGGKGAARAGVQSTYKQSRGACVGVRVRACAAKRL